MCGTTLSQNVWRLHYNSLHFCQRDCLCIDLRCDFGNIVLEYFHTLGVWWMWQTLWPAQSPDMMPVDFILGWTKELVYTTPVENEMKWISRQNHRSLLSLKKRMQIFGSQWQPVSLFITTLEEVILYNCFKLLLSVFSYQCCCRDLKCK